MDRILASKSDLEALIVSQETILGAMAINYLRSQKNKTRLTILLVPSVIRKNGTIESSTKLRKEEWSH
jgi:phosphopantetheine adenylyltransferase